MHRQLKKLIIIFIIVIAVFTMANFAFAVDTGMEYGEAIGLGSGDIRVVAVKIIQIALTFVGIIAVIIIMYGGFLWMTSEGDEAKLSKAKNVLKNAIIGLIIIMSSWAIVTFVLNKLENIYSGVSGTETQSPDSAWGLGVLGNCTIESVYPEPFQKEVPRNTSIIVAFKEEVDPTTICNDADGNGDGDCDSGEYIIPEHIRIYQTAAGDGCPLPCVGNILDVNVATNDNKTFIFTPVNYLGSPSEYIDYTVYLSNNIAKLSDGNGIFNTCSTDYFKWEFEVSNKIDLTPPQVKSGGVFPAPDNAVDDIGAETPAIQATGNIIVNSQPNFYKIAITQNPPTKIGVSEDATVGGDYICDTGGEITVSINGATSKADVNGPTGVVTGDDITDNIASLGCGLTLTPDDGIFTAGDSWTINVTAETQADTLIVGSITYAFVNSAPATNQIQVNGTDGTANNIASILTSRPDLQSEDVGNVVDIAAEVAGESGNNIILSSESESLTITAMSGGENKEVATIINDKKDKPRNAVIQINFNEAINPLTVSGSADEVKDYIRVVDIDGAPGNYLAGNFVVSNQYKTVEFISDNLCGVNGCGEKIYCLPENSHLKVELMAADLIVCPVDIDCSVASPFTNCVDSHCQNSSGENYPLSAIPVNGITDLCLNSLDGDRGNDAEGPVGFYNENIEAGLGDNYEWSFFINDKIDLDPPKITLINPANDNLGVSLIDPILINFSKVMMSSSLSTGETVIFNGIDDVTHKLINLWNFTGGALGYWTAKNNIDDSPADGEPDWTQAQIRHSDFPESTSYRAQVGSGVKDIYQNCFKPSASPTCVGEPSCCGDVPSAGESCP